MCFTESRHRRSIITPWFEVESLCPVDHDRPDFPAVCGVIPIPPPPQPFGTNGRADFWQLMRSRERINAKLFPNWARTGEGRPLDLISLVTTMHLLANTPATQTSLVDPMQSQNSAACFSNGSPFSVTCLYLDSSIVFRAISRHEPLCYRRASPSQRGSSLPSSLSPNS